MLTPTKRRDSSQLIGASNSVIVGVRIRPQNDAEIKAGLGVSFTAAVLMDITCLTFFNAIFI
jgi:hypothetical protein